jgi:hypothetical protein
MEQPWAWFLEPPLFSVTLENRRQPIIMQVFNAKTYGGEKLPTELIANEAKRAPYRSLSCSLPSVRSYRQRICRTKSL